LRFLPSPFGRIKEEEAKMRIAHLWLQTGSEWEQRALAGRVFSFADLSDPPAGAALRKRSGAGTDVRIIRADTDASPVWALIASPGAGIQINGRAPIAGLCVLNDRDFIRTAEGARCYFSSGSVAAAEPFPDAERSVYCGRCRQPMGAGSPAVCCPGCGIWYHQTDDLPCWTYSDQCSYCGTKTALDAAFSWTPED
jgi:hypothetical protein